VSRQHVDSSRHCSAAGSTGNRRRPRRRPTASTPCRPGLSESSAGRPEHGIFAIYFMSEDDVTRGAPGEHSVPDAFDASVPRATSNRSSACSDGEDGAEAVELNHYYERLDDWYAAKGVAHPSRPAEPSYELHNLTSTRGATEPGVRSARRALADAVGPGCGAGCQAADPALRNTTG